MELGVDMCWPAIVPVHRLPSIPGCMRLGVQPMGTVVPMLRALKRLRGTEGLRSLHPGMHLSHRTAFKGESRSISTSRAVQVFRGVLDSVSTSRPAQALHDRVGSLACAQRDQLGGVGPAPDRRQAPYAR